MRHHHVPDAPRLAAALMAMCLTACSTPTPAPAAAERPHLAAARDAAKWMQSGIPDRETPGFWNNVSMCCGSAGVADFFLQMHHLTGDGEYHLFGRRVVAQMMAKGTRDDSGLRWVQAENRTQPEHLVAQTGYMQGAAGMGTLLLRVDAADHRRDTIIRLPEDPYR